jgi:hypothetical protein
MEQSSSGEADSCSAGQEILHLLWYPKIHYHVHKSLPLDPILSKIKPVHILEETLIPDCLLKMPSPLTFTCKTAMLKTSENYVRTSDMPTIN